MHRKAFITPFPQSSNDNIDELKRNLIETVNLYYRALNWALSWVRQVRADLPRDEIDGFFLHYSEIQLLRLDLQDILKRLAERCFNNAMSLRPPLDYWSQAINRYAYRINPDTLLWTTPSFWPPDLWLVERLQLKPDPRHLPMSNILEAYRGYGLPLGLDPEDLVFVYDGLRIEEGTTLVNNVMAAGTNTQAVMIDLRQWRDQIFEMIGRADGCPGLASLDNGREVALMATTKSSLAPEKIDEENTDPEIDPRLIGHMVSRAEIARLVDRTPRTIKNWDAREEAPGGLTWHPADETTVNGASYDISKNWQTLLALTARTRDPERDRQLAQELLALKRADTVSE